LIGKEKVMVDVINRIERQTKKIIDRFRNIGTATGLRFPQRRRAFPGSACRARSNMKKNSRV
jgi:hypothetical protein